jgi:hypothetical protein
MGLAYAAGHRGVAARHQGRIGGQGIALHREPPSL